MGPEVPGLPCFAAADGQAQAGPMWILARLHGETQDAWFLRKVGASNHRCEAPLGSLKLHFQEGFLDGLSLWVKQNETVN
jgi:hypothetical protein